MHAARPLDPRPAVVPSGGGRRALLLRFLQPACGRSMARPARCCWPYFPELNEDLVAKQTHSPYNRGIALGYGNVYIGTVDGRLIAIDMKTGKPDWDTKLINSEKLTVGFTGAPLVVKDKVIIGAQGGEWPWSRPDLRRRRRDRQEELGVLHRRRHRARRRRPGATTPGRPAAAAAGCPAATIPRPTRSGGARPTPRRCTTGRGPMEDRAARGRATTCTPPR